MGPDTSYHYESNPNCLGKCHVGLMEGCMDFVYGQNYLSCLTDYSAGKESIKPMIA